MRVCMRSDCQHPPVPERVAQLHISEARRTDASAKEQAAHGVQKDAIVYPAATKDEL